VFVELTADEAATDNSAGNAAQETAAL